MQAARLQRGAPHRSMLPTVAAASARPVRALPRRRPPYQVQPSLQASPVPGGAKARQLPSSVVAVPPPAQQSRQLLEHQGQQQLLQQQGNQITDTPWSSQALALVLLSTACAFICNIDRAAMSVAVLPMSEQFSWDDSVKGAVASAFFAGYTVSFCVLLHRCLQCSGACGGGVAWAATGKGAGDSGRGCNLGRQTGL
jgi:hypothetical protein